METLIQTVQEKIKSLQWDVDYHQSRLMEKKEELANLEAELTKLQESIAHQTLL